MVDKASVRMLWPFSRDDDDVNQKTGLAGRPSKSRHLIEDELGRRAIADRLAPTLAAQSQALLDWLIETHPKAQRPTVRVVANNIRARYRGLKSRTK